MWNQSHHFQVISTFYIFLRFNSTRLCHSFSPDIGICNKTSPLYGCFLCYSFYWNGLALNKPMGIFRAIHQYTESKSTLVPIMSQILVKGHWAQEAVTTATVQTRNKKSRQYRYRIEAMQHGKLLYFTWIFNLMSHHVRWINPSKGHIWRVLVDNGQTHFQ